MRVQMTVKIGGYRNEAEWPQVGGCIDVPDHEGRDLIAAGYAKEAHGADQDDQPAVDGGEEAAGEEAGNADSDSDPRPAADQDVPDGAGEVTPPTEPGVQLPAIDGSDVLPPAVEKPVKRSRK